MAKNKKGISENMRKKSVPTVAVNKFEIKINKQKNKVLGQKPTKHDRGMPGVSKSKSIKKRMETLLVDYQKSKRVNSFEDKRIDKKDVSEEEKALTRFKLKHKNPAKMYNLNDEDDDGDNDDDEMTHRGQRISQLTTFDHPILSDDDDDADGDEDAVKEKDKALSSKYTEDNFGGGFLSRMKDEGGNEMSHKDRMAELVFQSIVDKNQRRKEKDEVQQKIDDLNSKMKSVLPLLSAHVNRGDTAKTKPDTLDVAVRMLGMLPRGTPSERVKSKEEIEKEENERIKREEEERQERMKAPSMKRQSNHVSVDAHGDEAWIEASKKTRYEGEEDDDDDDDSLSEESEEDVDDDDDDDDEEVDLKDDTGDNDKVNGKNDGKDDDEDDEESEDGSDNENVKDGKKSEKGGKNDKKENEGVKVNVSSFVESVKEKSAFLSDLSKLPKKDVWALIEFLKRQLSRKDGAGVVWDSMQDFSRIMWRLCRKDPIEGGRSFRHFIFDTHADFLVGCDDKRYGSLPTSPFVYAMLHLIPHLFPASDYHHPVCTPFFILTAQLLAMSRVACLFDVAAGLQLSFILFNCCLEDVRYLPEALNFLHSILLLHSQHNTEYKKKNRRIKIKNFDFLKPIRKYKKYTEQFRMRALFEEGDNAFVQSEQFKMESLALTLKCLSQYMLLYKDSQAFLMLFQGHVKLLEKIEWSNYPKEVEDLSEGVMKMYEEGCGRVLKRLKGVEGRPKGITFLEPVLDEKFGGKSKNPMTKDYEDRKRMARKEKRKGKDDQRKVRKDQAFLNQHILKEKIARNKEREDKTRRIMNDLAEQEGWYKQANKKRSTNLNIMADKKKEKIQTF